LSIICGEAVTFSTPLSPRLISWTWSLMELAYPSSRRELLRWSRFLRQAVKVDLMTKRMIHHEDTQAVHG
jgi:hypothetical protein